MPRKLTAQEFQAKHATRLKAAIPDVKKGVAAVTVNPCEQAAAKANEFQAAVSSEQTKARFVRGLRRVDLNSWKTRTGNKADRISGGIDEAAEKVQDFAAQFLPHVYAAAERIKAESPGIDLESGIARATAMIRANAGFVRE